MRQSRAPTASQIQNPPPPSSTTKSGRFFGKAGLGEFFSLFLGLLWGKKAHRFPLLAVYNPRAQQGTSPAYLFIQNILTPFLHSSLRCYDLKPGFNHIVTSQVHDSAQGPSYRLPAVISIIAAKPSSWSNYHDNRPSSDQKTNRFFSRRCGSCFPQNHRRCLRP